MTAIKEAIVVDVPVPVAYGQWTRFEEFPRFMEGVTEVRQLDDKSLHWEADVAGGTPPGTPRSSTRSRTRGSPRRSTGGTQNDGEALRAGRRGEHATS